MNGWMSSFVFRKGPARRRPPGELARRPWRTRRWRGRTRRCGWSWHGCAHTCPGRCSMARGASRRRRRHRLGQRRKRHSWGRSWHGCGHTCRQGCTTARGAGDAAGVTVPDGGEDESELVGVGVPTRRERERERDRGLPDLETSNYNLRGHGKWGSK